MHTEVTGAFVWSHRCCSPTVTLQHLSTRGKGKQLWLQGSATTWAQCWPRGCSCVAAPLPSAIVSLSPPRRAVLCLVLRASLSLLVEVGEKAAAWILCSHHLL